MSTEGQDYKRTAYRPKEVAELLGLSRSTVWAMMKDERLKYSVFCGIRFIARSDIPGIGCLQEDQKDTANSNEKA